MITLSCPSCGATLNFHSKASIFAVCSFCKSTLVRQDMNLETLGKMAEPQDEMTPFQIGSKGVYKDKSFELIGRLKVSYADGFWNEWYAFFANGDQGWLAEAQGFLAMCFPVKISEESLPDRDSIMPNSAVELKPFGTFTVDDIHDVVCNYSEGELPMNAAEGRRSRSVDLRGPKEQMATIEYASDSTRVFAGSYQDFDEFKFKHLREIDGW